MNAKKQTQQNNKRQEASSAQTRWVPDLGSKMPRVNQTGKG